jgi:hypothetical protein
LCSVVVPQQGITEGKGVDTAGIITTVDMGTEI